MENTFGYISLILLLSGGLQADQPMFSGISEQRRTRRQSRETVADLDNVIELVFLTDYSAFQFFSSLETLTGASSTDVANYMIDYLKSLTREVDATFQYLSTYSRLNIRLYFLNYQIAMTKFQSSWTKGNTDSDGNLKADKALADVTTLVDFLVTQLSFAKPDHAIALTKLPLVNIPNTGKFLQGTPICTTSSTISTSVIEMDENLPRYIAQVLGLSLGADYDVNTDCDNTAQYIMSDIYTENTAPLPLNPYKFSQCSRNNIKTYIKGLQNNCMKNFDSSFDYETFLQTPTVGERYTVEEQCQNVFGRSSSKCSAGVDCQGLDCLDPESGTCVNVIVGLNTTCDDGDGSSCSFGVCGEFVPNTTVSTTTTTSSTSSTSSTTTSTATTSTTTPQVLQPIDLGDVSIDIKICEEFLPSSEVPISSPLPSSVFVFSSEMPVSSVPTTSPIKLEPIDLGDVNIDIRIACGAGF